jgi:hypothetical protein
MADNNLFAMPNMTSHTLQIPNCCCIDFPTMWNSQSFSITGHTGIDGLFLCYDLFFNIFFKILN